MASLHLPLHLAGQVVHWWSLFFWDLKVWNCLWCLYFLILLWFISGVDHCICWFKLTGISANCLSICHTSGCYLGTTNAAHDVDHRFIGRTPLVLSWLLEQHIISQQQIVLSGLFPFSVLLHFCMYSASLRPIMPCISFPCGSGSM